MVLFAIVGELGAGKTLALSYLAWSNWYKKKRKIFSNYNFYGFPYTHVDTIPSLDKMKEGFFAGDELWLWLDSRSSKSEKQKIIASILLKSRKRGITIAYTTQSFHQVEKRIRDITDFIAYPMMNLDNTWCRLEIFRGSKPTMATRIKPPIYFYCEPIYAIYNTYEEISEITTDQEEKKDTFVEKYQDLNENPAWIKYLVKEKNYKTMQKIQKYCETILKSINPRGITFMKEDSLDETLTGL